jgi:hypothetical protein
MFGEKRCIIRATMRDDYWGFICKTEGCNFSLLVKKIGPHYEGRQITPSTPLKGAEVMELTCRGCHQRHKYERKDAQVLIVSEPE